MKYRFAIRSNGLYSPSFTLSKNASGVFLTLRDPLLYEKRSVHFENEIKHDKRHLYRGTYGGRHKKRQYEVVGEGQLVPECSYLLGKFSLCANEEEFHRRKRSHTVEVFDYDIQKNDVVTVHLVSSPEGQEEVDCPPSFVIVKDVIEGPMKWMIVLEKKAMSSVYDMVVRSLSSGGASVAMHGGPDSKGKHKHQVLVFDLHEDYRPQKHAQMSVVVANNDFEMYVESGQVKLRGYIVRR